MLNVREYDRVQKEANTFEGMMVPLSVATFQAFLSFQKEQGIQGDMAEFGVYRGKSASVLLNNLNEGETAHLVDVADYPELDKLARISDAFTFTKGKSEDLFKTEAFSDHLPPNVRFSHHDASHSYINVYSEMKAMAHRIGPGGLMVLDDFGNPSFFQVVAACFTYLAKNDSPIEILLYSSNKAYLCRSEDFEMYSKFLVDGILQDINQIDGLNCFLSRTDKNEAYRGFSMFPKRTPTDPDFYGLKVYGDQFYKA